MASGGSAQVVLNWTSATGASSYKVYRATTSGGPVATSLLTTGVTGTSYTDSGVTNGDTYVYQMTSVDSNGVESILSRYVIASPAAAPSAPTGLAAVAGNVSASLSWTASSG